MHTHSHSRRMGLWLLPALCAVISTGCGSKTRRVFVEYTAPADHAEVLERGSSSSPIRICFGNIDVNWHVDDAERLRSSVQSECTWTYSDLNGHVAGGSSTMEASTTTEHTRDGRLWANAIRSEIADLLTRRAKAAGVHIELVDRDQLKTYLDEKDLALADIIQGNQLTDESQLLPVDLFIFGSIEGQTCIRTKKETNTALNIISYSPYGGSVARRMNRPKQRIQRTITFAGNLAIHENATGQILVSHAMADQTIEDDRAKPWESDRTVVDLMPEAQVVRRKLDTEVRRFVGRLLPTPMEYLYTVKSAGSKTSKKAVELLGLGEHEAALALFEAALQEKPGDHRSAFGAGVACEKLGRLEDAEHYYRRAVMNCSAKKARKSKTASQYLPALQSVKARLARLNGESSYSGIGTLIETQ